MSASYLQGIHNICSVNDFGKSRYNWVHDKACKIDKEESIRCLLESRSKPHKADAGCFLGIGDWRILRLLRRILRLNFACFLRELCIKGTRGQYSVSKQQRHTQGPAQLNSIRRSVAKTGTFRLA